MKIHVDDPDSFHKRYDLTDIRVGELEMEELPLENLDKKKVEEILNSLSVERKDMLELDETYELELDEKMYYPILQMEDGNNISVDDAGLVYRITHDHTQMVKMIAKDPLDFFKIFNGLKGDLEHLMNE